MITTKPKPSQTEMNPPTKIQQLLTKANGIFSFQPDDTTPSSTPNATPTSSPQVVTVTINSLVTNTYLAIAILPFSCPILTLLLFFHLLITYKFKAFFALASSLTI